ncbi:MAG: MBL fold metallo-hydrolase [Bacteroidetes bacterium]|nr:MBL fold metallo-hydrolase [Bacteroidota bacterium]
MEIIQFEDKNLAHYSYAIISNGQMALIDPARNPQPYYDLAKDKNVQIKAVMETHPHADFISSHKEIHDTCGATIYVSKLLGAAYPHQNFDDGDEIKLGDVTFRALNTPGHSPDSISIVAKENGKDFALFSGDTLFIGDCGRPDLRETAGHITSERTELAKQMFHSLRDKILTLSDEVLVYPAHGAGSLCGKGLSAANVSTIGTERASNWSLQESTEADFIHELLDSQPFVPKYFVHSVELNKEGAPPFLSSIQKIQISDKVPEKLEKFVIIDTRKESDFKNGYLPGAINLMIDTKFETWLGSIVAPDEKFYLFAESKEALEALIIRIAKIGYEPQVAGAFIAQHISGNQLPNINVDAFSNAPEDYTIVDIRNTTEVKNKKFFKNTIEIPLPELRERVHEIPFQKPVVVHCAGGYRSAAGASIIKEALKNTEVYDLSYAISKF